MSDKRKHKRLDMRRTAKHRPYQIVGSVAAEVSFSLNLSTHGISFYSKRRYEKEDLVVLDVSLPGWEKERTSFLRPSATTSFVPLQVLARICWTARRPNGYEVGAELVGIDPDHRKALERFLKKQKATLKE